MKKFKHTIFIAVCIAIGALFHINYYSQGFIITLSIIILPVLLYYYEDVNPIGVGFASGIVSPVFRSIVLYITIKDIHQIYIMVMPDVFFYFSYGIFFYLFYYRKTEKNLTSFIAASFSCDFLSNVVEMSIRTGIVDMDIEIIKGLILIALLRSAAVLGIVIGIKRYQSFLIKDEHEFRYRRLMMLTASFKSEIYFMNKNMAEIEEVMKKSYFAYKTISENNYPEELKNLSLDIAKNVHEIKKDYIRVIKGLEEMSEDKSDVSCMNIKDIIKILEIDMKEYIARNKLDIILNFNVKVNFDVKDHFYLMSVFMNLINNGIEAMENKKRGILKVLIDEYTNDYVFYISDNGMGIKKDNLDYIYNPGFSTKFDKDTGNIERGIGLALVKDLVENKFKGKISVKSELNKGTVFTINIPKEVFGRDLF
ncbi:sensor histidine kinase [Sporanaerobacter sp. PP17-6a]|uniref:sensor histidine kinase n=1 Tax=Sporanaerobacter sp. PP17-6a TaxID=1891289 RepID=UPI0008A057ED|nr:HAMP domain-containing sensor histidine kinase [Sporanaerobacter sp. PP17-6a]SCL88833.1 Sensor protein ZraS [Sporanaerobacter sp. PP17-6a]